VDVECLSLNRNNNIVPCDKNKMFHLISMENALLQNFYLNILNLSLTPSVVKYKVLKYTKFILNYKIFQVNNVFKATRRDVASHSFESTRRRLGDHKARQGDALSF
jgi:hypothetical protein